MSEGIYYRNRMLGSVHWCVYQEGKLHGRDNDLFLRLNDINSLETILNMSPRSRLRVGCEQITYKVFMEEYLKKVRHILFENNSIGTSVHG